MTVAPNLFVETELPLMPHDEPRPPCPCAHQKAHYLLHRYTAHKLHSIDNCSQVSQGRNLATDSLTTPPLPTESFPTVRVDGSPTHLRRFGPGPNTIWAILSKLVDNCDCDCDRDDENGSTDDTGGGGGGTDAGTLLHCAAAAATAA